MTLHRIAALVAAFAVALVSAPSYAQKQYGPGASDTEIKSSYRRLAMKFHPDRNPGDELAEEKFKECAEAYAILADAQKRSLYDRFGHAGDSSATAGGAGFDPSVFAEFGDFADILGNMFGFGDLFGGGRRRGGPRRAPPRRAARAGGTAC